MSKKRDEISESAFEYLLCEILELSCDHEEDVGDDKKVLELDFRLLKGIISYLLHLTFLIHRRKRPTRNNWIILVMMLDSGTLLACFYGLIFALLR